METDFATLPLMPDAICGMQEDPEKTRHLLFLVIRCLYL